MRGYERTERGINAASGETDLLTPERQEKRLRGTGKTAKNDRADAFGCGSFRKRTFVAVSEAIPKGTDSGRKCFRTDGKQRNSTVGRAIFVNSIDGRAAVEKRRNGIEKARRHGRAEGKDE